MNLRTLLLLVASSSAVACSSSDDIDTTSTSPRGAVARTAQEAFPNAPASVPVLDRQTIVAACVRAGECQIGQPLEGGNTITASDALGLVYICADAMQFSAERAIPVSGWSEREQTADVWAACIQAAATCEGVRACDLERKGVSCQEDGCLGPADWQETSCSGSAATIHAKSGTFTRDCALAHASCEPTSPTGCTDRPYTACPGDLSKADRCDGDVRLGCDGAGQVSYHDCRRMGGTCGQTAEGKMGCVYPETTSECVGEKPTEPVCEKGKLSICLLGKRTEQATSLCP